MAKAISETQRRRETQIAFNEKHGIVPRGITRRIEEDLSDKDPLAEMLESEGKALREGDANDSGSSAVTNGPSTPDEIESAMMAAAARLDFEEAARLRDLLRKMQ
jgi:excinuclease ABC subunit B